MTETTPPAASAVLITPDPASPWRRLLARSGLSVRLVLPESAHEILASPRPAVLFFDIRCDAACRERVRAAFPRQEPASPPLFALLESEAGVVSMRDLEQAAELGAVDILLDESPASAIAARVRFALLTANSPRSLPRLGVAGLAMHFSDPDGASATPVDHAGFRARLEARLADRDDASTLAAIILDIDRFKPIVARYGREAGDRLLAVIGSRLEHTARTGTGDRCRGFARLQTDTFAMAMDGLAGRDEAVGLAERLLAAVSAPIREAGQTFYLQASAGISVFPDDAEDVDGLLRAAHSALAQAKARAGNTYAFHSPHHAAGQAQRIEIEHRLREALAEEELELHYQPIAEVATRRIVGVEALLRWHHPELGLIAPEQFVAVAEEAGLAVDLSRWALATAARELRHLDSTDIRPISLAINIPPDALESEASQDFAAFVLQTMRQTGIDCSRLTLEVTERNLAESSDAGLAAIERLRQAGIRIAIDDFGTGYASFAALKRFPVDEIKIDRSFLADGGRVDFALLRAVVTLAKALGIGVTAEGVERDSQLARLQAEGCDRFQGYLCAPAMPMDALAEMLAADIPTV